LPFYKKIRDLFSNNIRSILSSKEKSTFIRRSVVFAYIIIYNIIFIIEKKILTLKNRLKYGKLYFNKIYWVNPKKIRYISKFRVEKWYYYLRILNGNWDQLSFSYNNSSLHQFFIQRFKEGKNWEDTIYYQYLLNSLTNETGNYNDSKKKCDEKFRNIDLLYYDIKKNGYKTRREYSLFKRGFFKFDIKMMLDHISVDIGRNGDLLSVHGKHRLSITKLLDVPKIPIIIIKRHKKWMEFRNNLIFYLINHQDNKRDKIFNHPDLQNIPFKQGEPSLDLLKRNISISKGTLLDLGAKLGYFCHKFEDEGFNCFAAEENKIFLYLMFKLKKLEHKKFKIISESIFDYNKNQQLNFDVVLALNTLHHFLKNRDDYLNLKKFLKRLNVKELILETHNPKEFRNKNVYKNYSQEEFVNFILKNSCLNQAKLIKKTKTGRYLYKLTS